MLTKPVTVIATTNAILRGLVSARLEEDDYPVVAAHEGVGRRSFDRVRGLAPELVVPDVTMTWRSCLGVLAEFRRDIRLAAFAANVPTMLVRPAYTEPPAASRGVRGSAIRVLGWPP